MSKEVLEKYKFNFDDNMKAAIVDSVVEVYGEFCRKMVEDRINRIELIQYITPEDLKDEIISINKAKREELTLKFLNSCGYDVSSTNAINPEMKNLINNVFGWNGFYEGTNTDIFSFDKDKGENRVISKRCAVLKKFGIQDINPDNYEELENTEEVKQKIDEIENVLNVVKDLNGEFEAFQSKFADEKKFIDEYQSARNKIEMDAMRGYFTELKEFLPENERAKIDMALSLPNTALKSEFVRAVGDKYITNQSIMQKAYIEAFDDEDINRRNEMERVNYFKSQGLDLGYNYSDYKENEAAKLLIPPIEIVNKVKELREKYAKQVSKEIYTRFGTMQEDIDKINSLGLEGDIDFSTDFVREGVTAMTPNVRNNDNGRAENVNLLFFPPLKNMREYREVVLMHEILHCLECSMEEKNGEYFWSTGFEKGVIDVGNGEVDADKNLDKSVRKYEKFSENIHQELAMEVYENLQSKGVRLLPYLDGQKTRGCTSYERLSYVTSDFYRNFKSEITSARMTGNTEKLKKVVGRKSFDEMNDLVSEYNAMPYNAMMLDVVNKKETPLTAKRMDIKKRADRVVSEMANNREEER